MSTPQQVIVATFDAANKAEQVVPALQALGQRLHTLALGNIAILEKTPDGAVQVHETHDPRGGLSRIASNAVGSVAWLVYGFFGLDAPTAGELAFEGTEAAIKRVVHDMGFDDTELALLGEELDAGSSALILVVPADTAPVVAGELAHLGGTVVQRPFTPDVAAELDPPPTAPAPREG